MAIAVQSVRLYHSIGTIVSVFPSVCFFLLRYCSKIIPSFFTIKEGSTFLTKPLFPQGREDVTALRCSEPLRYKVGGPKRSAPDYAGWDRRGCRDSQLLGDVRMVVVHSLVGYIVANR